MMRLFISRQAALYSAIVLVCQGAGAASPSSVMSYEYDAMGNVIVEHNGLQYTVKHAYDALARRKTTTDQAEKITQFEYDLLDQLTKVTDARSVATTYVVDGMGRLTQTTSGDTGVSVSKYDEAGNRVSITDAKNQTTLFDYDALNRVKLITYADSTTVTYLYDQTPNAIGRLSQINDASGSTRYDYDSFGRVVAEVRTIGGVAYTTGYRFDQYGRPAGMDYPSGRRIDYQYDSLGRVAGMSTLMGSSNQAIVSSVSYEPFGGVQKVTFGNGQSQTRTYDQDGRLDSFTLGGKTMALTYDAANRIKGIADAAAPTSGTSYDYDRIDRLTGVITPTLSQVYGYDDVGNRTSKQLNGSVKTLTFAPNSNRLTAVGAQAIVTDENGSITSRGDGTFKYDVRGRLISFQGTNGLTTYTINGLGQRVRKVTPTETTVFHYDQGGKLIAETTTKAGVSTSQEYIYLGDMPVAVLK